jgi:hypothetical protein
VGVDIDKAGADITTVCIDGLAGRAFLQIADGGYATVYNGEVGAPGRSPAAVDQDAVLYQQIVSLRVWAREI